MPQECITCQVRKCRSCGSAKTEGSFAVASCRTSISEMTSLSFFVDNTSSSPRASYHLYLISSTRAWGCCLIVLFELLTHRRRFLLTISITHIPIATSYCAHSAASGTLTCPRSTPRRIRKQSQPTSILPCKAHELPRPRRRQNHSRSISVYNNFVGSKRHGQHKNREMSSHR